MVSIVADFPCPIPARQNSQNAEVPLRHAQQHHPQHRQPAHRSIVADWPGHPDPALVALRRMSVRRESHISFPRPRKCPLDPKFMASLPPPSAPTLASQRAFQTQVPAPDSRVPVGRDGARCHRHRLFRQLCERLTELLPRPPSRTHSTPHQARYRHDRSRLPRRDWGLVQHGAWLSVRQSKIRGVSPGLIWSGLREAAVIRSPRTGRGDQIQHLR
jgi:hypothetical protein